MRGCWSSSVEDCSASCARKVTRCSERRRISSELMMSENSTGPLERNASRMIRDFASASAFAVRAAVSCPLESPSCWLDSELLLEPMKRLDLERYCSTLASASPTVARRLSISPASQRLAARVCLLGGLLQPQITIGYRVGDACR